MGFAIDRSRTIISAMILGRRVTAQDVVWLRREVFGGGVVSREEADELFAVARANMNNAPEWKEFFVEMIARHVVRQSEPIGVVSEERAAWLLTRVDECSSLEALAALVHVLAEARSVPEWLLEAGRARVSRGWPNAGQGLPAATTG
jgi:acetyl-CoA acetyltransferase